MSDSPLITRRKHDDGKEAGAHLRQLLDGKVVSVDIEAIDRYGRSVGTVYLNHQNVNLTMVKDGYAWVYREYSNGGDDLMMGVHVYPTFSFYHYE